MIMKTAVVKGNRREDNNESDVPDQVQINF